MKKNATKNKRGGLVVIDGIDGSGKGTQTELLLAYLARQGVKYEKLDFPQYGKYSAYFVEKYLRGEYGTLEEVGPKKASLFYALDRFDESAHIKEWLDEGVVIISNRYTTSNIGHQAAKIDNEKERNKFLDWLTELEYDFLDIPEPDMVICLYISPELSQKLVDKKKARSYTHGLKRDLHEGNLDHLKKASARYLAAAKKYKWTVIDCGDGKGGIRPVDEIHREIIALLEKKHII